MFNGVFASNSKQILQKQALNEKGFKTKQAEVQISSSSTTNR